MDADVSTRRWDKRWLRMLWWTGHAAVMALSAYTALVVLAIGSLPFAFGSEHSADGWLFYSIAAIFAAAIFAAYPFVWWVTKRRTLLGLLTVGAAAVAVLVSVYYALTM